ncbi:hypothetical protein SAMN05421510_101311 [Nitrosomonas ureae]|uniref:Uncharacterized protein n=1 Tax=Nitrosomonas ureae TaxID=44577 RepID=A0A1H9C6E5_9PROT|nr:hypothetical protein C8R28_101744 [Nitrosomonas ureae]PXX15624.1 hypothetical protein C8R27_10940 [Nitrosomonas ureae]SDU08844.1 hypothetical protein SAMN05216406_1237 [Nitrosomonas ureae]SEP96855.1 hypothetical protein SAMN05421510_101311 [Nitrosomonas ureae]SOD16862.1 hypothetical protein SAMN06297164_0812 [Nitrosomonas ureae]
MVKLLIYLLLADFCLLVRMRFFEILLKRRTIHLTG